MLSKMLWVLGLAEPIKDIHYHFGDSIDSVKGPVVLLLASPITPPKGTCTLQNDTRICYICLRNT